METSGNLDMDEALRDILHSLTSQVDDLKGFVDSVSAEQRRLERRSRVVSIDGANSVELATLRMSIKWMNGKAKGIADNLIAKSQSTADVRSITPHTVILMRYF